MTTASLRETHVRRDYDALCQLGAMTINDAATRITVHGFNYPDGWTPETAALLIRYPDTYPRMQPQILIPKKMRYNGRVTHRLNATRDLKDDWVRWCTHYLNWQVWRRSARRKDRLPIVEFIKLIRSSLNYPHKTNPITHARRRR